MEEGEGCERDSGERVLCEEERVISGQDVRQKRRPYAAEPDGVQWTTTFNYFRKMRW